MLFLMFFSLLTSVPSHPSACPLTLPDYSTAILPSFFSKVQIFQGSIFGAPPPSILHTDTHTHTRAHSPCLTTVLKIKKETGPLHSLFCSTSPLLVHKSAAHHGPCVAHTVPLREVSFPYCPFNLASSSHPSDSHTSVTCPGKPSPASQ